LEKAEKVVAGRVGEGAFYWRNQNPLYPHGAMTPVYAIAMSERPPMFYPAAGRRIAPSSRGAFCYESFTRKVLSIGSLPPIFPGVMSEAFTNTSRGAGAAVRALRGNNRPRQFSARKLLSFSSDIRHFPSAI
jgi:hypothetical protein